MESKKIIFITITLLFPIYVSSSSNCNVNLVVNDSSTDVTTYLCCASFIRVTLYQNDTELTVRDSSGISWWQLELGQDSCELYSIPNTDENCDITVSCIGTNFINGPCPYTRNETHSCGNYTITSIIETTTTISRDTTNSVRTSSHNSTDTFDEVYRFGSGAIAGVALLTFTTFAVAVVMGIIIICCKCKKSQNQGYKLPEIVQPKSVSLVQQTEIQLDGLSTPVLQNENVRQEESNHDSLNVTRQNNYPRPFVDRNGDTGIADTEMSPTIIQINSLPVPHIHVMGKEDANTDLRLQNFRTQSPIQPRLEFVTRDSSDDLRSSEELGKNDSSCIVSIEPSQFMTHEYQSNVDPSSRIKFEMESRNSWVYHLRTPRSQSSNQTLRRGSLCYISVQTCRNHYNRQSSV